MSTEITTTSTRTPTPHGEAGSAPQDRLRYIPPGFKLLKIGPPVNFHDLVREDTDVDISVTLGSHGSIRTYIFRILKRGLNLF